MASPCGFLSLAELTPVLAPAVPLLGHTDSVAPSRAAALLGHARCGLHPFVPWAWAPVLQGRTVDDYLRHAVDLADIIYELAAVYNHLGIPFRVGVGSICRRAQVDEVRRIVAAVAAVLPNVPLHLLN